MRKYPCRHAVFSRFLVQIRVAPSSRFRRQGSARGVVYLAKLGESPNTEGAYAGIHLSMAAKIPVE